MQQTRTISYPYPEKPRIEWFEMVSKSKKSGATSQLKFTSEKNYSYDSIYVRPNGIRFAKSEIAEDDKLYRHIYVGDSLYTYHFKSGILNRKRVSFGNYLMNESNYNPQTEKLLETFNHTYYPEKEYGGLILWKTEHQNFQTQKTKITYPYKKKYKLKDNVLIERKKLNLRLNLFRKRQKPLECGTVSGCGVHAYEIRRILPYYLYNIASTSVLADHYFLARNFDSYILEYSFPDSDVPQNCIQAELFFEDFKKSTFSDVCKTGKVPRDFQNELIKITKKWYSRKHTYKDFKVEIITQDNKKFECKPIEYLDQIHLPIDVFSYRGDY